MIGPRRVLSALRARRAILIALIAVVAVAGVLSRRSADPFVANPAAAAAARAMLATAASDARSALAALARSLDRSLSQARTGAALTVAGDAEPGPHLAAAADALTGDDQVVVRAQEALARVAGQLAILRPRATRPTLEIDPGAVGSAAAALRDAVDAANAFRDMRRASQASLVELGAALAALDGSDPSGAIAALGRADQQLAAVQAWPGKLSTLPIWIDTTGRLLAAARRIAVATRDGDPAAAEAAGADYAAAARDAHQADLALSIAVAEGGSGVSAVALGALADVRDAVARTMDELDVLGAGAT